MNVLVTIPAGETRTAVLPPDAQERLERIGDVTWNPHDEQFSPTELRERLAGTSVLLTGWGCPLLDAEVLSDADQLELVSHVGGSVAFFATPHLYDRGVTVCSANAVMASFVAEAVLAYALAGLRDLPATDAELKDGGWRRDHARCETLFGKTVGFVGLGTVGRAVLDLLDPFDVDVLVYDPYVTADQLDDHEFAELVDLETALAESDVVSIHAAKTPETIHLLDAERLGLLRDDAFLINAARGAIADEEALAAELQTGRISAVLDVFETEPLPEDSPLRTLDNAILVPHMAASPARPYLGRAAIGAVERFVADEPLECVVSRERFQRMTDDRLATGGGNS